MKVPTSATPYSRTLTSSTAQITSPVYVQVQQGRTGNDKDISSLSVHTSKPDFSSPVNMYKPPPTQVTR